MGSTRGQVLRTLSSLAWVSTCACPADCQPSLRLFKCQSTSMGRHHHIHTHLTKQHTSTAQLGWLLVKQLSTVSCCLWCVTPGDDTPGDESVSACCRWQKLEDGTEQLNKVQDIPWPPLTSGKPLCQKPLSYLYDPGIALRSFGLYTTVGTLPSTLQVPRRTCLLYCLQSFGLSLEVGAPVQSAANKGR